MKRLIIGGMSALLASAAFIPAARADMHSQSEPNVTDTITNPAADPTADTMADPTADTVPTYISQINPFELVYLTYYGFFEEQGIPGFDGLITAYQSGSVTAETLVEQAIARNRLPSEAIDNSSYVGAVDNQLQRLQSGRAGS